MHITISLRNLDTSPCEMIVEAKRDVDFDSLDPGVDLKPEDEEPGAFEDFVRLVREKLPIKEKNVDVFISWWGDNQTKFYVPLEFFLLIAETRWPVVVDIND